MSNTYRAISVRGVIRKGELILVEWFSPKSISFLPGGTVEENESLEVSLMRELAEELNGIEPQLGRYLGKIEHSWSTPNGRDSCLNHFFEIKFSADSNISARENGREMRWISLSDESSNSLQPPSLRKLLLATSTAEWDIADDE